MEQKRKNAFVLRWLAVLLTFAVTTSATAMTFRGVFERQNYSFRTGGNNNYPLEPDGLEAYLNEHPNREVKAAMWKSYENISSDQTAAYWLLVGSGATGIGGIVGGSFIWGSDTANKMEIGSIPFFGGMLLGGFGIFFALEVVAPDMDDYLGFFLKNKQAFPNTTIEIYEGDPTTKALPADQMDGIIKIRWDYQF